MARRLRIRLDRTGKRPQAAGLAELRFLSYLYKEWYASGPCRPSQHSEPLCPPYEDETMNIDRILRSVVAVRASIPEDAFTANTLGTRREGSGVVIRENGLVLTIGYLITEADEVWLTSSDGRAVPAHVLAYDQESGFGLVQALGQLGLPALTFGDSAGARIGDPVVLADG